MENDVLQINNYEMEDIGGYLKGLQNDSEEINTGSKQDFRQLVEMQIFDEGMKAINNKLDRLNSKLNAAEKIILNNTNSIGILEQRLKEEASGIVIPTGYEINNTVKETTFGSFDYKKIDGASVNEGIASTEKNLDETTAINKENLGDISGNTGDVNASLNEYTNNNSRLGDITSDASQQQQDLEFRNVVNGQMLNGMNTSNQSMFNPTVDMNSNSMSSGENTKSSDREDYLYDDGHSFEVNNNEEGVQ